MLAIGYYAICFKPLPLTPGAAHKSKTTLDFSRKPYFLFSWINCVEVNVLPKFLSRTMHKYLEGGTGTIALFLCELVPLVKSPLGAFLLDCHDCWSAKRSDVLRRIVPVVPKSPTTVISFWIGFFFQKILTARRPTFSNPPAAASLPKLPSRILAYKQAHNYWAS